jgi:hypothetical protein
MAGIVDRLSQAEAGAEFRLLLRSANAVTAPGGPSMTGSLTSRFAALGAVVASIVALLALVLPAQAVGAADPPSLSCPPAPGWSQSDVTCTVSGGSTYADAVATDNPSLHWRLGEGSGTTATDASGAGHTGTYNGGFALGQGGALAGSSNASVDVNGTNGRVNSTYNPFANGGVITVEGWANRDTSTTDDVLFGGTGSTPPRLVIAAGSNDVRFRPVPSGGAEQSWTNAWPGTGQWVHWAVVLSESTDTAELYINGVSKGTRTVSQAYATTPGSLQAGAVGSTNNPFDGRLDEVAVYEHGLSAQRIAAHYQAGAGTGVTSQERAQTNGGSWSPWTTVTGSSFPITAEGTTQVETRVSGSDGSVSATSSKTVKIDKTDPTPELSCPPAPDWSQTDVTCTVTGEDSTYADSVSADDPSLEWRLAESSGTDAADASGQGHAGTYNGGHSFGQSGPLSGSSNPSVDFDGTNGRVNSSYNPFVNGGQITIEGWANRDTNTTDDALFGGNGSSPPRLLLMAGSNDVQFRPLATNGTEQTWTNAWPDTGQWVHWAVILRESTDTAELFINGNSLGTRTVSQAYATTPGNFEVGVSGSTNNPFDGRLDEVAVYGQALSAQRIAAHHDAGVAPSGPVPGFDYRSAPDGGTWSAWAPVSGGSIPVGDEGQTQVETRMSDVAGNEATAEETAKIDTGAPGASASGPLTSGPNGWVDQGVTSVTGSTQDAQSGVTKLALSIDGQQVDQATQTCANGSCSLDHTFDLNTSAYSGGAHDAKVVATDAAGNTQADTWTVNVDPQGTIPADEATDTLRAAEPAAMNTYDPDVLEAPPADDVAPTDAIDPEFTAGPGQLDTTGTPVDASVSLDSGSGFSVQTDGSGAIDAQPTGVSLDATAPKVTDDVAAVYANTDHEADTEIRPIVDGLESFTNIRDADSPQSYSWHLDLTGGETLQQLDSQSAQVVDGSGTPILSILADPAHDAAGNSVSTALDVSGATATLTVQHQAANVTYPVTVDSTFDGGYTRSFEVTDQHCDQSAPDACLATVDMTQEPPTAVDADPADIDASELSGDQTELVSLKALPKTRPRMAHSHGNIYGPLHAWQANMREAFLYNNRKAWHDHKKGTHVDCLPKKAIGVSLDIDECGWRGPNPAHYGHGKHLTARLTVSVTTYPGGYPVTFHHWLEAHDYGDGYVGWHSD